MKEQVFEDIDEFQKTVTDVFENNRNQIKKFEKEIHDLEKQKDGKNNSEIDS